MSNNEHIANLLIETTELLSENNIEDIINEAYTINKNNINRKTNEIYKIKEIDDLMNYLDSNSDDLEKILKDKKKIDNKTLALRIGTIVLFIIPILSALFLLLHNRFVNDINNTINYAKNFGIKYDKVSLYTKIVGRIFGPKSINMAENITAFYNGLPNAFTIMWIINMLYTLISAICISHGYYTTTYLIALKNKLNKLKRDDEGKEKAKIEDMIEKIEDTINKKK